MINRNRVRSVLRTEAGFSMVEMMMASMILAIGVLGLTLLQTMSVRATTGSRGLTTAVMLAERAMDEIEADGRNSLLYAHSTPPVTPIASITNVFLNAVPDRTFNFNGRPSVGDPIDPVAVYTVVITRNVDPTTPGIVAPVTGLGGIAEMSVLVRWNEGTAATPRQVTLSRRIAYATA